MSRRKVRLTTNVVRALATLPADVHVEPAPQDDVVVEPEIGPIPSDWQVGALLNVRNAGTTYNVTLFPEEDDWRHPERTLRFTNPGRCQDFVSRWYSRQHFDPRAF